MFANEILNIKYNVCTIEFSSRKYSNSKMYSISVFASYYKYLNIFEYDLHTS